MSDPVRILIVEDRATDAELAQREIRKTLTACEFQRVETRQDFLTALDTFKPDLIISDYQMPRFDGMTALTLSLERAPLTPVIVWTGSLNEDIAVECMKSGATNYVLKENIKRLGPAVVHALDEKRVRLERRQAEEALRESQEKYRVLVENATVGIIVAQNGMLKYVNPTALGFAGYSQEELASMPFIELIHPEDQEVTFEYYLKFLRGEETPAAHVFRIIAKDGRIQWLESNAVLITWEGESATLNFLTNVTERKRAEAERQRHTEQMAALDEVALQVQQHLDPDQIYRLACEELRRLGPIASIYQITDEGYLRHVYTSMNDELLADYMKHFDGPIDFTLPVSALPEGRVPVGVNVLDAKALLEILRKASFDQHPLTAWMLGHMQKARMLVAPLTQNDKPIGIFTVVGELVSGIDEPAIALFARQMSVALENARLYDEAQRRLEQTQALHSIDMVITSSLDLRLTLSVFLDETTARLHIDAADILLRNSHMQTLDYAAGRGFQSSALQHTRLRLGESIAGRVALERRPISIPDLAKETQVLARAPLLANEKFVSYIGVPLIAKGDVKGVLEIFHRAPMEPDDEWMEFLNALATQAAIAIDSAMLYADLQRSNTDLMLAYDATIQGWSQALDMRDRETQGHTERVAEMAVRLARAVGIAEPDIVQVRHGALLHDIGKMGVPDAILLKPDQLTDEEWRVMRKHPEFALQMLSPIAYLVPALDIPYCHHEKWDGTGYPRGLRGDQIPPAARVFTVVDVWDALRSDRPYRPAWTEEQAREYIEAQQGKHFDPQVVQVFLPLIKDA
jgi:PAS domain S-box-containing protein